MKSFSGVFVSPRVSSSRRKSSATNLDGTSSRRFHPTTRSSPNCYETGMSWSLGHTVGKRNRRARTTAGTATASKRCYVLYVVQPVVRTAKAAHIFLPSVFVLDMPNGFSVRSNRPTAWNVSVPAWKHPTGHRLEEKCATIR